MRRRMFLLIPALILVALWMGVQQPQEARALQAYIEKVKSDCTTFQAAITLIYNHDDTGDSEQRDYFRLEVYDMAGNYLTEINESITKEQSPFYWQTGRVPTAPWNGKYRIDMYDMNDKNEKVRIIDQVWYDCTTEYSWRDKARVDRNPELPRPDCWARVEIYTTNLAPEDGAMVVMFSFSPDRLDNPDYIEYHAATFDVGTREGFDHVIVKVPCGTYMRVYYQPDSNKLLYNMPSQYWPYAPYGVPLVDDGEAPVFYTFFPLDGPLRDKDITPSPVPSATPTETPTPTPLPTSSP